MNNGQWIFEYNVIKSEGDLNMLNNTRDNNKNSLDKCFISSGFFLHGYIYIQYLRL